MRLALPTIAECLARAERDRDSSIAYARSSWERACAEIERNFHDAQVLVGAGFDPGVSTWSNFYSLTVDLGARPRARKARAAWTDNLRKLRRALGCPLVAGGKWVADAATQTIGVRLRSADNARLSVEWTERLPRKKAGAANKIKCRVVKRVVHDLVCSAG